MHLNIEKSWKSVLNDEFHKDYFLKLKSFVEDAYQANKKAIFPPKEVVFKAFDACPFEHLKVVILGQDPYPTKGHANGLCFSINADVKPVAKSLINIFKEIETDLAIPTPLNGDLSRWSSQGVLLLNAILSVDEGKPRSHQNKGWEQFTDAVIQKISNHKENVVFLLWGGYARAKGKSIDRSKHLVLESGHPSPMSANRGLWFGNKHFSQTNEYLKKHAILPISW